MLSDQTSTKQELSKLLHHMAHKKASVDNINTALASCKLRSHQSLDGLSITLLNEPDRIWKSDI